MKKTSWKILSLTGLVICVVGGIVYSVANYYVVAHAEASIRDLLLSHKGVHHYVQNIMHPALYKYKEKGQIAENFYAPELLSSSFLVRNMHNYYNEERVKVNLPQIYYKMANLVDLRI